MDACGGGQPGGGGHAAVLGNRRGGGQGGAGGCWERGKRGGRCGGGGGVSRSGGGAELLLLAEASAAIRLSRPLSKPETTATPATQVGREGPLASEFVREGVAAATAATALSTPATPATHANQAKPASVAEEGAAAGERARTSERAIESGVVGVMGSSMATPLVCTSSPHTLQLQASYTSS